MLEAVKVLDTAGRHMDTERDFENIVGFGNSF